MNWPKQRAWGWYATLIRIPWFCLKLLRFKSYGELSMQRHEHRTEIWIFLNNTGTIMDNLCGYYYSRPRIWKIQPMTWHKYIAKEKPVYVLEIQYGRKVTENDIERK